MTRVIVQASAGPDLGNPYSGGSMSFLAQPVLSCPKPRRGEYSLGDTSSRWGDKDIMEHQGQGVQCGMETPEQGVEATEDSRSLVLACLGSHLDRPRRSMMSADIITDCPSSLVPPVAHGTVSDHSSPMV